MGIEAGSGCLTPIQQTLNKLHVRRGAALCGQGQYGKAITDYSQVLHVVATAEGEGVDPGAFAVKGLQVSESEGERV